MRDRLSQDTFIGDGRISAYQLHYRRMKYIVNAWALLLALSLSAATAGDPAKREALQREVSQQGKAASDILRAWQSKNPDHTERKLHIVYWSPKDRTPAPRYAERLSKILEDIRGFYSREMVRLGFGPGTIQFDHTANGLIRIHLAQGSMPYANYSRESGKVIRDDCVVALRKAGIDSERETIVIFCNMANWDPTTRTITQNSPYYARGTINEGTAWQVDSPILDLDSLTDKGNNVKDGQYGNISLGRYNSIFIGGIAHELGHALSLPHCKERDDERAAFGTALMGAGNRTYGKDRRGEGYGSFLTMAEGIRLAGHPMFNGNMKQTDVPPSVQPTDLKIEPSGKGFRFSGTALADPPVYGIVAYMDPEGGKDYDATTTTAVPDAAGHFTLDCESLKAGTPGTLRITYLQANGVPSGTLSQTPFNYPYSVSKEGKADISAARAQLLLAPVMKAVVAGDAVTAKTLMATQPLSTDEQLQRISQRLVNTIKPQRINPADIPSETRTQPLSDLVAVTEKVGWGRKLRDRLPDERGLLIAGGQLYEHGFYAHADAVHEWQLDGSWKLLVGSAGVADGKDGTVEATIEGDGRVLWKSSKLSAGPVAPFRVNITGVKRLTLKITDAGDGKASDWGVWLQPTLAR